MDNIGLIAYCQNMSYNEKTLYMWGGLMNAITEYFINYKAKQYPSRYTESRKETLRKYINKAYGCDCAGLIKSYYFGGVGSPGYEASKDLNASGMFNKASEKGPISTLPETVGIGLYQPGHVGVYAGNGIAYECTLGSYGDGVVKTKVAGRGWTNWFKVPFIDYINEDDQRGDEDCNCDCNCPGCICKEDYYNYTVVSGDSFWGIAKKVYGDGNKYPKILEYNGMTENDTIYAGDILKIPV